MVAKRMERDSRAKGKEETAAEKRVYFKQADFPLATLQQAQRIASALVDNFAGKQGSPPDIALALESAPRAVRGVI